MPPFYELRALLTFFVYMHNHIILLYTTTIHLPTRSHTTYFLHFRTRSIHPTRMSFLITIPRSKFSFYFLFLAFVYHTPPGFDFGLHVHVQHDAIII